MTATTKTKLKPIVTYRLEAEAESHARTVLRSRDLLDISDEPVARGGTNEGFAPTEFLMAALAACTNVIAHKIAAANGFEIDDLAVTLEADFNQLGVNLIADVEVPFPVIRMTVDVATPDGEAALKIISRDLRKYCAISKVIRQSGTEIVEQWRLRHDRNRAKSD